MTDRTPAILGGTPAFPEGLPLVRPEIPDPAKVAVELEQVLVSGVLTNGPKVQQLEELAAQVLEVPHVVAVSSCTAGLMLVYQALGVRGPVVMPSMTFSASAHAVVWAGGTPRFADVDAQRITLDPDDVSRCLDGAAAISATHVYGAPVEVERLQQIADAAGLPIVYDAAHALGTKRRGRAMGAFGAASVFSMSPTKVAVAGEGGLIATTDPALADELRSARNYGNPGDYDCRFPGLNARMSELHATVGLASLRVLEDRVRWRQVLVERFAASISGVPGVSLQRVDPEDRSSWKDLTLILDPDVFGLDSSGLQRALRAEGIDSRRYYHPAIHRQKAYAHMQPTQALPVTDLLDDRLLTPPLFSSMAEADMDQLGAVLTSLHRHERLITSRSDTEGGRP